MSSRRGFLAIIGLSLLLGRYLFWRTGSTLELAWSLSGVASVITYLAEILLLLGAFLPLWYSLLPSASLARRLSRLRRIDQAAADLAETMASDPASLPEVDILIPTLGEPLMVIERCLHGCLEINYPAKTVWVLDDGARPEIELLCQRLGCRYLAREDHRHAKAGNLNHALPSLKGELLAVFDADVVPLRNFLALTVGLFSSSRVGFVQTPQHYLNSDPIRRNLRLERWMTVDEECFYSWIQPIRYSVGATMCAGTSFVMRRSALEAVGGFETGTPSEDLATAIRVVARGYEGVYIAEKLSAGLVPHTLEELARQRCRWASGSVQTLWTGANPLTIPGLNPIQRIAYFEQMLLWINTLPQLWLVLLPFLVIFFQVVPIHATPQGVLLQWAPFYTAQLLVVPWLCGHSRTSLAHEVYRWTLLTPIAAAVIGTFLGRPRKFRVTPKSLPAGGRSAPSRRLLLPLVLMTVPQVITLGYFLGAAAALLPWGPASPRWLPTTLVDLNGVSVTFFLFLCGINLLLLLLSIRACWDRAGLQDRPWFSLSFPATIEGPLPSPGQAAPTSVRLVAISEVGVELADGPAPPPHAGEAGLSGSQEVAEYILRIDAPEAPGPLPIQVVRSGGGRLGALWGPLTSAQRRQLDAFLFHRPGLWPRLRNPYDITLLPILLLRVLKRVPPEDWFSRSLVPQSAGAVAATAVGPTG